MSDSLSDPRTTAVPGPSAGTADYQFGFGTGEYFIRTSNPNLSYAATAPLADRGANSGIAIDARVSGSVAGRYLEVGCRQQPGTTAADLRGYVLRLDPADGQFQLVRIDGKSEAALIPWQTSPDIYPGEAGNRLELDCYKSTLTVLINGQSVGMASDSTYGRGVLFFGAGVFSNADPGTVEGRFKNLVVTGS